VKALALLLPLSLLLAACDSHVVAIEVMPPRTSATCSAPTVNSAAAGRGLLDLDATRILHGAYEADLRITARGGDLRVDGIALSFSLPESSSADAGDEASRVSGLYPLGDLFLQSNDEDPMAGLIEDVILLPRSLAVALRDDTELEADEVIYATVNVTIQATRDGDALEDIIATFPIDVCRGCLVAEPSSDDCPGGIQQTAACRPGQDVELYECAAAAPPVGFP
jgi:hypothetical protein